MALNSHTPPALNTTAAYLLREYRDYIGINRYYEGMRAGLIFTELEQTTFNRLRRMEQTWLKLQSFSFAPCLGWIYNPQPQQVQ